MQVVVWGRRRNREKGMDSCKPTRDGMQGCGRGASGHEGFVAGVLGPPCGTVRACARACAWITNPLRQSTRHSHRVVVNPPSMFLMQLRNPRQLRDLKTRGRATGPVSSMARRYFVWSSRRPCFCVWEVGDYTDLMHNPARLVPKRTFFLCGSLRFAPAAIPSLCCGAFCCGASLIRLFAVPQGVVVRLLFVP